MQLFAKIAIGTAAVLLIVRLIKYWKTVHDSIKRLKTAEARIKVETAKIRQMSVEEAELLGRRILNERANLEPWSVPVPENISQVLEKLDGSLQSLFAANRKWYFPQTGTEFNADYILGTRSVQGARIIALDKSINHKLLAKERSPVILELNEDDRPVEEYPSIFHYFLLAEKE